MKTIEPFTQFAAYLVESGESFGQGHQDDSETPIVASTIEGVLGWIAEALDVGTGTIVAGLDEDGVIRLPSEIFDKEIEIRQEIVHTESLVLVPAELNRLRDKFNAEDTDDGEDFEDVLRGLDDDEN